jgi:hypothetical protein
MRSSADDTKAAPGMISTDHKLIAAESKRMPPKRTNRNETHNLHARNVLERTKRKQTDSIPTRAGRRSDPRQSRLNERSYCRHFAAITGAQPKPFVAAGAWTQVVGNAFLL